MWNVKRVLILIGGTFASLFGYAIYAFFLSTIDAMPPLPDDMLPTPGGITDGGKIVSISDQKLEQSFGANCQELRRPLRLWLSDKGMALAAGDFNIEKDGKVKLAPFSAAMYHKSKGPGAYPEISTIRCDVAILTLDRPVSSYSELNNRKVIAVEMIGKTPGITLTNNRRTVEKSDDIDILITNGNLFYEERQNLIWTDGVVCLRDYQTKPHTEVRGKGLQMELTKDNGPSRPRENVRVQAGPATNDNGNVEKIRLRTDVDMHFWVDASSGFLGGIPNEKNNVPPRVGEQKPAEKAHVHIKTGGPFVYDLKNETAYFESPPQREGAANSKDLFPIAPDQVHVERSQKVAGKDKFDQLICDRLDLQFRKRSSALEGNAAGGDKEIETAKATRRDKNEVVLSLDSEQMAAYGTDLFYRAGDLTSGPLTILKGEPLKTVKDGHKMVCKELHLFAANRAGDGQKAIAKGKGQIDLIDTKNPAKATWPTHILWDDTLTVVKEKEGGQVYDLMTVVGDASFIDDQQKQQLHGEKILVWILHTQESAKKPQAGGGPKQELQRVLAINRVRASSPEFIIRQADRFHMIFLPQQTSGDRLPDEIVANRPANPPSVIPQPGNAPAPIVEDKAPVEEKKAPPIELTGNEVTGTIFTLGSKKELQELIAKGNVYVFQPGDKPGEKRIDITGQLLTVKYAEKGHTLVVHGDGKDNLARLEMGELILWGPIVTVNRGDNRADVAGRGAMQMPSNKNLDGTEASKDKNKKPTRLTIYWQKGMNFDGRTAIFNGGVQAFQQDSYSKMQCENMWAYLDKFVSFKEGQKENQNAKIDKILCDKNVFIDDSTVDERKQLLQRNLLQGTDLRVDNLEGGTNLTGPGVVRLLAKGNATLDAAPGGGAAPARLEWKLTQVNFSQRMFSNIKANTKNAKFYGYNQGVEVFHFATTDINAKMNADRPAKDQLYLRCGILFVEGRQTGERTTQYMIAEQSVEFRTDKYLGYADVVKYDESTDIVIFEGVNGNPVRLYEFRPGDPTPRPASVNSSKVLYNRKSGALDLDGVKSFSN